MPSHSRLSLSVVLFSALIGALSTADTATATDLEILDVARNEGRIVVTLDRDFTNLLALERSASPSVIYLRLTGLDRDRSVHAILDVLGRVPDADGPGYVAVVSATGIRVRLLPI